MRNILLAGVALVGFSAVLTEARADGMAAPLPNITAAPGKTDGAAPGSVSVNIGLQELTAIMAEGGTNAKGDATRTVPQLFNWFHIFPSAEYVNPAGIHFAISAEIRNNNSGVGAGAGGNTLYLHQVSASVSSATFGKVAVGSPNGALDDLGVGTGDDFGNGLFYSWYGPPNAPPFAMADSYDGDTPRQKIVYETPDFGGFKGGISYQPNDVSLDHSTGLTNGGNNAVERNRIEVAVQFNKTFGNVGIKADIGGVFASAEHAAGLPTMQNVSYFNAGLVGTISGIELEGSISSGKFNAGPTNVMSPGSPSPAGSKNSTVYIAGIGYNMGPIGIGAVYYGMSYDDAEGAGNYAPGAKTDTVSGEGLGASYVVGPGVTLQFDAYTYTTKVPAPGKNTNGSIVALASQFAF